MKRAKRIRQLKKPLARLACLELSAGSRSNALASTANTAIAPVPRTGSDVDRQNLVLERARESAGDSITEGWEGAGKRVWNQYYGARKIINMVGQGFKCQFATR